MHSVGFSQDDRNIGEKLTLYQNTHKVIISMHAKYVEDLTVAEALKMKNVLNAEKEEQLKRPLNYHQRTEHSLKQDISKVALKLNAIQEHPIKNKMLLNKKKTKVMVLNTSTKYDFQPELKVYGKVLDVVSQMKLLGVIVSDDLRCHENTIFITKKADSRIWILRRLKQMGANSRILLNTYYKQIGNVLEFACVVWSAGLTQENIAQIERV